MKYYILIILLILITGLSAQHLTQDRANAFIRTLIYDRPSLDKYFDPIDLAQSNRLKIQYEGVDWKILIGHDIDVNIREKISTNQLGYNIRIRPLEYPYFKLLFTTSDSLYKQAFFFKNDMMISPLTYFTRHMIQFKRGYVTFYTTDPTLLSDYSMRQVSSFIKDQSQFVSQFFEKKSQSEWLSYQDASWRHYYGMRLNPIMYILCKDARQIEQITGFNTLGLSDLSMDAVITTSNSHYHELMHIIINYNLNPMPLYTHPLLQEGIATCLGGRSGKSAEVMVQTGEWLKNMNIIPIDTLFAVSSFQQQDASISYPLSSMICRRFIDQYGMKKFNRLYKKYSTDEIGMQSLRIDPYDLQLGKLLSQASDSTDMLSVISVDDLSKGLFEIKSNQRPVYISETLRIWKATSAKTEMEYWKLEGYGTFLTKSDDPDIYQAGSYKGHISIVFKEQLPEKEYHFEHYLLKISEKEISLYDLYLDQLIAFYNNEFVPPEQQITVTDGKVIFYLDMNHRKFNFKPVK